MLLGEHKVRPYEKYTFDLELVSLVPLPPAHMLSYHSIPRRDFTPAW